MMRYGTPIMVAGIAFAINEQFDKILLSNCCRLILQKLK
jgi:O-antigen/teichoic acid export membrane protein